MQKYEQIACEIHSDCFIAVIVVIAAVAPSTPNQIFFHHFAHTFDPFRVHFSVENETKRNESQVKQTYN